MDNPTIDDQPLHAVSLFSNCGAGDVGYRRAGFLFEVMAELDPRRLEVALINHPGASGITGDLRETWPQVVSRYREKCGRRELSLLAACPPCQGMSSARGLRGTHDDADAGSKDERNLLAVVIANVAKALTPRVVVVENVPEFLVRNIRHPETGIAIPASKLLIELLEDEYRVFPVVLDMSNFGVPQTRKRTFLTFIRRDLPILEDLLNQNKSPFPKPNELERLTISQALQRCNLPKLDAASPSTSGTGMHSVPVWNRHMYDTISAIASNSGKSAWTNNVCGICNNNSNDNEDLYCNTCGNVLQKPRIVEKNGKLRLIKGFHTSYKRMRPDQPAPTILTASGHVGSHNTVHPTENRVLSTFECAVLQTLHEGFEWGQALTKWGHTNVRAMIGEAVPPKFTQQHGEILKGLLTGNIPENTLDFTDPISKSAVNKLNGRK